jgi:predicted acylesterase/phospholipase RssA
VEREDTAHVLVLSGGGWRGAVQYWVLVDLMSRFEYAAIVGTSVGSVNGVMASMGKLDELLKFWKGIDGLKGYLSFRWFYLICWALGIAGLYEKISGRPWMGGFYSMRGLHNKLLGYCRLDEIKTPFIAGVVSSNSGTYYNLDSRKMRGDERLALACLASSCMSPFMTPPLIQLEDGGEREAGFDGGGRNIFPLPEEEIARLREEGFKVVVHAIGCMPRERIEKLPTIKVSGIIELALRGLEILEAEVYENDMVSDLRKAVGPDGEVHIWLPAEHPGGSFDAKPEDIERRLEVGKDMVEAGPALVLTGLPSDEYDESEESTDPGNLHPPK